MGADDEYDAGEDKNDAKEGGEKFRVGVKQVTAITSASNRKDKRDWDIDSGKFEPRGEDWFSEKIEND